MKFEVVDRATNEDLKQMIELDKVAYVGSDVGDYATCARWLEICPEIYTAVRFDGKIVGYINFVPISKRVYREIRNGRKKDYQIATDDILPFSLGENHCLFMSIVVDKNFRFSATKHLFSALKNKIEKLSRKGKTIKSFIADCVTKEGEALAKHFDGNYLINTISGSKIYEFIVGGESKKRKSIKVLPLF